MINLRLPNITATTERGQLEQIRSYLYQFAEQLNWALNNIDKQATEAKQKIEATTGQKNAVEEAQATFAEVKSLVIKSADIVNAYYKEINHRLEGVYVAESDFGIYKQETELAMKATSEDVELLFTNTQTIESDVSGLTATVGKVSNDVAGIEGNVEKLGADIDSVSGSVASLEGGMDGMREDIGNLSDDVTGMGENLDTINGALQTNGEGTTIVGAEAWCKIGVLDYDDNGFPIYGMEIGQVNTQGTQTVSKSLAQYRSDGVHLYDQNGIEVATISDYKLKITNAEMINAVITNSLNLGGYEITTGNGLAFKWKGRGNG